MTADEVVFSLSSSLEDGLQGSEAKARLEKNGPNHLYVQKRISLARMFIQQLSELLMLILMVAGLVSVLLGEFLDAWIIFIVVIINAVVGVLQEYKAEKALDALKKIDPDRLTPREALDQLYRLKEILQRGK